MGERPYKTDPGCYQCGYMDCRCTEMLSGGSKAVTRIREPKKEDLNGSSGTSQAEYDRLSKDLIDRAHAIETMKRPDYTVGDVDVLKNFKATGEEAKITAEQAWIIFAKKHWDAIRSIMLAKPGQTFSEPPRERFADLLNYLKLGYALYRERERERGGPSEGHGASTASVE